MSPGWRAAHTDPDEALRRHQLHLVSRRVRQTYDAGPGILGVHMAVRRPEPPAVVRGLDHQGVQLGAVPYVESQAAGAGGGPSCGPVVGPGDSSTTT